MVRALGVGVLLAVAGCAVESVSECCWVYPVVGGSEVGRGGGQLLQLQDCDGGELECFVPAASPTTYTCWRPGGAAVDVTPCGR